MRVEEVGTIMDVADVDLTPFRTKGGKIILVHGTSTTSSRRTTALPSTNITSRRRGKPTWILSCAFM